MPASAQGSIPTMSERRAFRVSVTAPMQYELRTLT